MAWDNPNLHICCGIKFNSAPFHVHRCARLNSKSYIHPNNKAYSFSVLWTIAKQFPIVAPIYSSTSSIWGYSFDLHIFPNIWKTNLWYFICYCLVILYRFVYTIFNHDIHWKYNYPLLHLSPKLVYDLFSALQEFRIIMWWDVSFYFYGYILCLLRKLSLIKDIQIFSYILEDIISWVRSFKD